MLTYNPLFNDVSDLSAEQLDSKISELTRKYFIAARSGNSGLCQQILVAIEGFKQELSAKNAKAMSVATRNGDKNFDDLINVNK
jgi:hypothetical protein